MPVLVNPYLSFGGVPPIDITEPWGEVARQTSISGGMLTASGLDLSGLIAVQLIISGITVTTDDTQVFLKYLVAGSVVSTGYRYALDRLEIGSSTILGSNGTTALPLCGTATRGVGNASTEGLGAEVLVFDPSSTTLHKRCHFRTAWLRPDGTPSEWSNAGATLENTGAITGFEVSGDSNLTGGSVIVLGVE